MDDKTFDILLKKALEISLETEMAEYPSTEELKKIYPIPDDRRIQLIPEAASINRKDVETTYTGNAEHSHGGYGNHAD